MINQENQKKPQLLRKLNLLDTTFLVIGAVIGSGIFMTTGFIAEYLPSPGLILIVWMVGGFIALSGALSFAELGAMFPKAGGQYIYIREAYGSWAGFFYGPAVEIHGWVNYARYRYTCFSLLEEKVKKQKN